MYYKENDILALSDLCATSGGISGGRYFGIFRVIKGFSFSEGAMSDFKYFTLITKGRFPDMAEILAHLLDESFLLPIESKLIGNDFKEIEHDDYQD